MRILILVAAAFAGGWLVGALVQPEAPAARSSVGAAGAESFPARRGAETWDGTPSTRPGGTPGAETRRELSTRAASLREVAERAAESLAKVLALDATATFLAGDGTISGTVRDAAGEPVAGAVVTASPEARPFGLALSSRLARERAHEDRDLADVAQEAIENELWRREVRRVAVSGSDGRYELKRLVKSGVRLVAYHDRYEIRPVTPRQERVEPDATVDFVAQAVAEVAVEVRLPDGARPENAWITWQGPHGSGSGGWTSDAPRVRMGLGTCKVRAQAWAPAPLQSAEVEHLVTAQPAEVALLLQLEGRRVLTARLVMPEGLAMPDGVEFGIRRADPGGAVDAKTLKQDQFEQGGHVSSPGRASWYDREAGRYLIAAFLDRRALLAHAFADLKGESLEVELKADAATGGRVVSVLGPGGEPVLGAASLQLFAFAEGRLRPEPARALRRTDGTWLVAPEAPEPAGDLTLRVTTRDLGSVSEGFDARGRGPLTVRFERPGQVRLRLGRHEGSPAAGRLHAALWTGEGAIASRQVDATGACDLAAVQPGEFTLYLAIVEGGNRWPILRKQVRFHPGDNTESLSLPVLSALTLRAPANFRGRTIVLQSSDPDLGWLRREAPVADGVATFDALAPATYEIQYGGKRHTVRLTGPAEVRLE